MKKYSLEKWDSKDPHQRDKLVKLDKQARARIAI